MFAIVVEVWDNVEVFDEQIGQPMRKYVMNHDDAIQRRVLGSQCRNAFEGAQVVVTYPFSSDMTGVDLRGIQA